MSDEASFFRSSWYPTAEHDGKNVYDPNSGKTWSTATVKGKLQVHILGKRKILGRILGQEGTELTELRPLNKFWLQVVWT